jgi:surface carbohydrate biosynthesis protein
MAKTLILPAEIYSREFDARLLQGLLALSNGWRVIVGSKALINRSIWRLPRGVYLCQTLTHKRLTMLKILRKLGFAVYGWDEEGLIYLNRDVYLMRRVSMDTLAQLESVITWGFQGADDLGHRSKKVGLTPLPFGNPRFDLVRPDLHALYATEVSAIRQRYGNFVLINTNFSSFNPIISVHDLKPRTTSDKHPPSDGEKAQFAKVLAHRKGIFERFLTDLPAFTRKHSDTSFVIRAHPGENEETWKKVFSGQANVFITREGSSVPWLIAAQAMIHNSCTTAVEAAIAGLTPICYCPILSLENESDLPNPISHRVYNFAEMADAINRSADKTLRMTDAQSSVLRRHVSAIDGPLAAQAIMDHLAAIEMPKLNVFGLSARLATRIFGALRHAFKSQRRDHITDRYLSKVFPDISEETVRRRAREIAGALKLGQAVEVRSISRNIFELSLTK